MTSLRYTFILMKLIAAVLLFFNSSSAFHPFHRKSIARNAAVAGSIQRSHSLAMIAQNFPRPAPRTIGKLLQPSTYTPQSPISGRDGGDSGYGTAQPVVVGIAGGSASGKTTFARQIVQQLGEEHVSFIGHDNYYRDLTHLSVEERAEVNFDHPDSLETDLLVRHLCQLKARQPVELPVYDFSTHTRSIETMTVQPSRIIIVDGILIFAEPQLLPLMDMKIFVDTEDDLRLIRRIERDIRERGRSVDSVIEQYRRTVRPMHQLYVEPSKRGADIIVPTGPGECRQVALDMCVSHLREIINFYQ